MSPIQRRNSESMVEANTAATMAGEIAIDGDMSPAWFRLTKAVGSSDKNAGKLGSFGIGKHVPYACSNLRSPMVKILMSGILSIASNGQRIVLKRALVKDFRMERENYALISKRRKSY